jgi:hypothetical protein
MGTKSTLKLRSHTIRPVCSEIQDILLPFLPFLPLLLFSLTVLLPVPVVVLSVQVLAPDCWHSNALPPGVVAVVITADGSAAADGGDDADADAAEST